VFFPRIDLAALKDLQLIVTAGESFLSEESAGTESEVSWLAEGVPAFALTNTCRHGRYALEKVIVSDPLRPALLQLTRFRALQGEAGDYRLYVLAAPRLGNRGTGNSARVGEYKGQSMLFAETDAHGMALACSVPWLRSSVGYVGCSDGWEDLHTHHRLTWNYETAPDGNVALVAEIDLSLGCEFVLALGFGHTANEAAHRARSSLALGFPAACQRYVEEWADWQRTLLPLASALKANTTAYRVSTAVIGAHESKAFPGGIIASLTFPWGETHGDQFAGGYHLVWPRDACETAGALLAAGAASDLHRVLRFFQTTQEADGRWPQNMWLDGTEHWKGTQLDEVAAPILLLDLAARRGTLSSEEANNFWPMVRRAAGFLVRTGPATPQDRWEEDAGLTLYSLACSIAALLVAAELAERHGESGLASYLREAADYWNDSIEHWLYVRDTPLARQAGVTGYYVRFVPRQSLEESCPLSEQRVRIANLPDGASEFLASEIVSPDVLGLVRWGLRSAHDVRIVNTLRVVDSLLKIDTPNGPCWRRYTHDAYGEHADGSAFDGRGIGRPWPLLVGERAHYELAAGNRAGALDLIARMERFASDSGLIPEQVWDAPAIPERDLFPGQASGSARPLVWAHAEHIKMLRSLHDGSVFDLPPQTVRRYQTEHRSSALACWRLDARRRSMPAGRTLRIETADPCTVRWSADGWISRAEIDARDSGVGVFFCDLPTEHQPRGTRICFTLHWRGVKHGEDAEFSVAIETASYEELPEPQDVAHQAGAHRPGRG
jgi:glucoamylase